MAYNLNDVVQLQRFDKVCNEAIRKCPQCEELPLLETKSVVSVAEVFRYWFRHPVLWDQGYHTCLCSKARMTFEIYALFKDGRVWDHKRETMFNPQDEFRVVKVLSKEYL